jgi:hypothetical protein
MDVDPQSLRAFITQVDSTGGATACWPWRGSLCEGYGRFGKNNSTAHRAAYELMRQPIPEGLVIDHICHNGTDCAGGVTCQHRRCVNPDHLQAVRQAVNIARSPLTMANINAAKTHCPRSHEYTPENTRRSIGANGGPRRDCRTCSRERAAARRRTPVAAL